MDELLDKPTVSSTSLCTRRVTHIFFLRHVLFSKSRVDSIFISAGSGSTASSLPRAWGMSSGFAGVSATFWHQRPLLFSLDSQQSL